MSRKNVLILGYAGHGKDELREFLNNLTGRSSPNTSLLTARNVMLPWFDEQFPGLYDNTSECYKDRVNWRAAWHNVISKYNSPDKARLCKEVLEHSSIYVGIRKMDELEACKDLFDMVIWVDRDEHVPVESDTSNEVHFDESFMLRVDNNGRRGHLLAKARNIVMEFDL